MMSAFWRGQLRERGGGRSYGEKGMQWADDLGFQNPLFLVTSFMDELIRAKLYKDSLPANILKFIMSVTPAIAIEEVSHKDVDPSWSCCNTEYTDTHL